MAEQFGCGPHQWSSLTTLIHDAAAWKDAQKDIQTMRKLLSVLLEKYGKVELSEVDVAHHRLPRTAFYDAYRMVYGVR